MTCLINVNSPTGSLKSYQRKMSTKSLSFVQQYNHVCNQMEWKVVSDDYDFNQEIATSCYGDMLHDTERNQKFGLALKKAIKKMHSLGKKAHVLDIGTGTGLLSMLAVRYGADTVVACEAFQPMAMCAISIIEENNFSNIIKVVKKHSTDLTVGEEGDLKHKANILVSEVFDTELIGEGAIKTFNHAHKHLLEDDCIVIPSVGTIYVQVVESDLAMSWNQLQDWKTKDDECLIEITDDIKKCPGAPAVHDIQLSQLKPKDFKMLSKCVPIFRFDWSSKTPLLTHRQSDVQLRALASGRAQVVFMWWDLLMDEDGEIVLSCAPVWEHPESKGKYLTEYTPKGNPAKNIPWRDHWMQAVYFLTEETTVKETDLFTLNCYHDEFSFWFKVNDSNKTVTLEKSAIKSMRPVCECGVHFLSRTRVGAINCWRRRDFFLRNLTEMVKPDDHYIVFGDMSLLGLLIARLGAKKVDVLETSPPFAKAIKLMAQRNHLESVTVLSSVAQVAESLVRSESGKVSVVSEPSYRNSVLPWDNISFWYMKSELMRIAKESKPELTLFCITPGRSVIRGCAIRFDDLWKIARRLDNCEGFSMKVFDDLIEAAKAEAEAYVEPQPLWEYPGVPLTEPFTAFELDFAEELPTKPVTRTGSLSFSSDCRCDGVALWMEYTMNDRRSRLSTGPVEEIVVNEYVSWDMFERQGVHLFRDSRMVKQGEVLYYEVTFLPVTGEFNFKFDVKQP